MTAARPARALNATPSPDRVLSILFVGQHDFDGPTEKQALGFAQELIRRGHRVAFTLGGSAAAGTEGLELDGITVVEHRLHGRAIRQQDADAARRLAPDLVHALNPRAPTVAAAAALAETTGAPAFVHFEDDDWRFGERLLGEPLRTRAGQLVRRLGAARRPDRWPHATAGTLRWIARHARGLDALTPALAEEVTRRTGRPCAPVLPVTPALAEQAQAPAELELTLPEALRDVPLAVFSGTLYPVYRRDVELALAAVAEVQRRGHALAYVHPGRVHERIDPLAMAAAAGLREGTAVFPGLVPFAAIPPLLRRASVLLQPGAPSEFNRLRLPSKLQAYLASGSPTVTFAVGFGELLEDRVEVLKTYTGEVGELADRIVEVLVDGDLRARLAVGGPAAARRLFDPVVNTAALEAHYRAGLAGSPS